MKRSTAVVIDLLAVTVFALIGRLSHELSPLGLFSTAWPFLVACLAAWALLWWLKDSGLGRRAALIVWAVTLIAGMGLRLLSGETAAIPFVIVSTIFLGLVLPGWRLLYWAISRRRTA